MEDFAGGRGTLDCTKCTKDDPERGVHASASAPESRKSTTAYETSGRNARCSTPPAEASGCVPNEPEGETRKPPPALPAPTPELFLTAGTIVADWAAREHAEYSKVEALLRRAVDQAVAIRGGGA